MKARWLAAAYAAFLFVFAGSASAVPITFIGTGTGSGSIGGTIFADTAFTLTSSADTDDWLTGPSTFGLYHTSSQIALDGLGTFQFVTPTWTFVNPGAQLAGWGRDGPGDFFHAPGNAALATWDRVSSIGPFAGPGATLQLQAPLGLETSGGTLHMNNAFGFAATFEANVAAIPEPQTYALLLAGLGLLGFAARRRAR